MFVGGQRLGNSAVPHHDETDGIAQRISFVGSFPQKGDGLAVQSFINPDYFDLRNLKFVAKTQDSLFAESRALVPTARIQSKRSWLLCERRRFDKIRLLLYVPVRLCDKDIANLMYQQT